MDVTTPYLYLYAYMSTRPQLNACWHPGVSILYIISDITGTIKSLWGLGDLDQGRVKRLPLPRQWAWWLVKHNYNLSVAATLGRSLVTDARSYIVKVLGLRLMNVTPIRIVCLRAGRASGAQDTHETDTTLMVFSHKKPTRQQDKDKTTTRQMLSLCSPIMPFTPGPTNQMSMGL